MKIITTNEGLKKNLSRLIENYTNIAFAVAWASAKTEIFQELSEKRSRIRKAVIGTHFYQTHPDVLDTFVGSEEVRSIYQPNGVFHPKVYIFWDQKHWEILIGSANLTYFALYRNSEVMVLISDADEGNSTLKEQILELIENYWKDASIITKPSVISYRARWSRQQRSLQRLSGQYGKSTAKKPPMDSLVVSMSWEQFLASVKNDPHHEFENRRKLLKLARSAFDKYGRFDLMEIGLRKTIAGLPNNFEPYWGFFGSMNGAGYYHRAVNENNRHLSQALDKISLTNVPVTREHYTEYLAEFIKAFPNGGDGVAVASRLLALKRPDQFVCIDSKNKRELCRNFGIKQIGKDYDRYWEEIIEQIMDSVWW
ncbi:MAG: phospholipase D-like domain-containing protein, partial [Sedimentisphaerales bacterium]